MASLTGFGELFSLGSTLIDKLVPDKGQAAAMKLKMLELEQAGELRELEHEEKLVLAQTEVNKQEAAHDSVFVAGWRPGLGWVCVAAMFCNYIGVPFIAWISPAIGMAPPTERLDIAELMALVGGMLGLGQMRMKEKLAGVVGK